jgi:hypothetical protein
LEPTLKVKFFALAVALLAMAGYSSRAQAQSAQSPAQACKANDNVGFGSFDACVVNLTYYQNEGSSSGNDQAVAQCKYEQAYGEFWMPGVTTFGECVALYEYNLKTYGYIFP